LYARFDASERAMGDRVLAEWALSADEGTRFDALVLIREFKVRQAIAALRELARRLEGSAAPSAPFELEKVKRLILDLAENCPAPLFSSTQVDSVGASRSAPQSLVSHTGEFSSLWGSGP